MSMNELRGRVRGLGRYLRRLESLKGGAGLLMAAVGAAAASFLLDWTLVLPVGVRILLLFGSIVFLLTTIYRGVLRPLLRHRTEEDLALLVERRHPDLKDGLISSLQFSKKASGEAFGESTLLQEAVIAGTVQKTRTLDFHSVVDSRKVYRFAALGLLVAAVPVVLLTSSRSFRDYAGIWWKRDVALSREAAWPRQTFLEVYFRESKNLFITQQGTLTVVSVAQGDDLTVCVKANGKVPSKVNLVYRTVTQDAKTAPVEESKVMAQVGDHDFQYAFVGLSDSFVFHVEGGDDRGSEAAYHVRILPAPRVESLAISCTYPPYMRREPTTTTEGSLRVPVGTRADLLVRTNMKLQSASIALEREATRPMEAVDEMTYRGGFVVTGDLTYSILLVGDHGLTDKNPLRFQVKSIADEAPKVAALSPSSYEFDATPEAVLLLKTICTDDYGLSDVRLVVKMPRIDSPFQVPLTADGVTVAEDGSPFAPGMARSLTVRTLELKDLLALAGPPAVSERPAVEAGDSLYFRVEARDEHTSPDGQASPNVGRCQDFRVSITNRVDLERKLSDWQLRIKDDVKKLRRLQEKSKSDLDFFLAPEETLRPLDPAERQKLLDLEIAQNRISTDSKRLTSDFVHLFDAHLFNRLEKGPYPDRLLSTLVEAARDPKSDAWAGYRKLASQAAAEGSDDSDLIAKLLGMVASGLGVAEAMSPDAARHITAARLLPEGDDRLPDLRATQEKQQAILDELDRLLKKMDEWEDYQSILDSMRQLIDDQKAIRNRTISEIKRSLPAIPTPENPK